MQTEVRGGERRGRDDEVSADTGEHNIGDGMAV